MHCVTNIQEDLYWLGASDRRLAKFENVFPIPRGVSYNAYLVLDENDRATTTRLMKVKAMLLQEAIEERREEDLRAARGFT